MKSSHLKSHFKVVIIGAGLSGLSAARTLMDCRRSDFVVLERDPVPGGRVRTLEKDGFRLDRGFQVGLSSYPAFQSILPVKKLRPRYFGSGALVEERPGRVNGLANPLRHPRKILGGIFSKLPLGDRIRLVVMAAGCLLASDSKLTKPAGQSSIDWLKMKGFSDEIINKFFRPFFGGVFLDDGLQTDASLLRFYLKKFVTGRAFVPEGGMGEMGITLASEIPSENICYETEVERITSHEGGVEILLKEKGQTIRAEKVILAVDPATASRLAEWEITPEFRSTKVVYFKSDRPVYEGKWIVLPSKSDRLVQHFVQLTNVAPGLAPEGQSLLSATVLKDPGWNDEKLAGEVKKEISHLYPKAEGLLEVLAVIRVPLSLPEQTPEALGSYAAETFPDGVIPAGDLVNNASLQNALASGKEAALRVMNRL
jgi:protoporphyrinogen oxidase